MILFSPSSADMFSLNQAISQAKAPAEAVNAGLGEQLWKRLESCCLPGAMKFPNHQHKIFKPYLKLKGAMSGR